MERITISLKSALAKQFDDFIQSKGYSNRSEAMRDLIRDRLESERYRENSQAGCVAILSYLYSPEEFDLPTRLAALHHRQHSLVVNRTQIHLNDRDCLESLMLRGPFLEVKSHAERVIAERGVRHGRLHIMPAELGAQADDGSSSEDDTGETPATRPTFGHSLERMA